jgi:hypothetical protein
MTVGALCDLDPGATAADTFLLVSRYGICLDKAAEVFSGDGILDVA